METLEDTVSPRRRVRGERGTKMRRLRILCFAGVALLCAGAVLPAIADEGGPPKKDSKKESKKESKKKAKKKKGDEGGPPKKG